MTHLNSSSPNSDLSDEVSLRVCLSVCLSVCHVVCSTDLLCVSSQHCWLAVYVHLDLEIINAEMPFVHVLAFLLSLIEINYATFYSHIK